MSTSITSSNFTSVKVPNFESELMRSAELDRKQQTIAITPLRMRQIKEGLYKTGQTFAYQNPSKKEHLPTEINSISSKQGGLTVRKMAGAINERLKTMNKDETKRTKNPTGNQKSTVIRLGPSDFENKVRLSTIDTRHQKYHSSPKTVYICSTRL